VIRRSITPSFVIAALVAIQVGAGASTATAQSGPAYDALKSLPNFAGSWTPSGPLVLEPPPSPPAGAAGATQRGPCPLPPMVRAEVVARCLEAMKRQAAGGTRDYCASAQAQRTFAGFPPQGPGGAFEMLYTPGRATMAVESGLVRRIYFRDQPPPGALDVSRSGTSIGRWEGATLVVETTGLDPNAPLISGAVLGAGARVMERLWLVDADTLRIQATLTAPALLTAPVTMRQDYRRAPDRVFTDFDTCVDGDRSFDRTTGQDRFDRTPPADLPPPPVP
jgi:hypothetical protein